MQQLSWTDDAMLRAETATTPIHIHAVMIYDPATAPGKALSYETIVQGIAARLHKAPSFRQKLVSLPFALHAPYWVDDPDFDLEFHIRHMALPQPGDWRQLCLQLARLHARPLDLTRPPWELTVIEGLDRVAGVPKGAFAMCLKVHHCAVDGIEGAQLISAIHDLTADAPLGPDDDWSARPTPSVIDLVRRTAINGVVHPIRASKVLVPHAPGGVRKVANAVRALASGERLTPVPNTRFGGSTAAHRVVEARFHDFAEVKEIRKAVPGCTVNDVALAYIGGAMRAYLLRYDELPAESLIAACPISLRRPDEVGAGGNMLFGMRQSIGTDIADPIERLASIMESTAAHRSMGKGVKAPALLEVAELLPGALLGIGMRAVELLPLGGSPIANTTVTNVPGPQVPLYFRGAKLVRLFGLGPVLGGINLIHIVGTYAGEFGVSVTADRAVLPDPQVYGECLDAAFAELLQAAGAARRVSATN